MAANSLSETAPSFVDIAHRIVWATVATVDTEGEPRTRVLHPIWEWNGSELTGWVATSPASLKAKHLARQSRISMTYWDSSHDVATCECETEWETDAADLEAGWDRFVNGPEPVGYDPAMIPGWEHAQSDGFGILRLAPTRLRVMPGSVLLAGEGDVLTWGR